jgi:hypothetical protein
MRCKGPNSTVLTGGGMPALSNIKKCLLSSRSQAYLLRHVGTDLCYSLVIWFEAVNCLCTYSRMLNYGIHDVCRAKYPLALLNHLMSVFGEKGGCAYDIGCAFSKTLGNSSLGPRAAALNLRLMVGAFHGHAHNRRCQLDWHPMYINGTGHTEGEGCEHVFSASNELARSTRHASAFHRHQTIEEHFAFWDADKYAALSMI